MEIIEKIIEEKANVTYQLTNVNQIHGTDMNAVHKQAIGDSKLKKLEKELDTKSFKLNESNATSYKLNKSFEEKTTELAAKTSDHEKLKIEYNKLQDILINVKKAVAFKKKYLNKTCSSGSRSI